jgi:hypothetical protein
MHDVVGRVQDNDIVGETKISIMRNLKKANRGMSLVRHIIGMGLVLLNTAASGEIFTGSIIDYQESAPPPALTFGDGLHTVTLWWSVNQLDRSGYFYMGLDTQVALATGVSSINQISDASLFSFTTGYPGPYYVGPVYDVPVTGGLNSFVVLHNQTEGFYGVVRVDDIFQYATPINHGTYSSYSGLNATWWFQSDGSGNFSVVPEPSTIGLITSFLLVVAIRIRRKC